MTDLEALQQENERLKEKLSTLEARAESSLRNANRAYQEMADICFIEPLKEALEFYANEANWKYYQHEECFALDDRGKRAKEALKKIKEME